MRRLAAVLLAATSVSAFAQTSGSKAAEPQVTASVDRTAIWIGDRVTYTIAIVCPRGLDVLEDDLSKDKLKLDGLDLVGMDSGVSQGSPASADATTRIFRYVLTTYRVDRTSLTIAPMTIRYYITRAGQRPGEGPPAGDVQIPGVVVAFRSTIPDELDVHALRDDRVAIPRSRLYALAQPVGLALVVVSIVPAVMWGIALGARRRGRTVQRSARQVRREQLTSLETARTIDVRTPEGRREAYTHIDTLVRTHLRDVYGVAGLSLTPPEVASALASHPSGRIVYEAVTALLAQCETARYGPPAALPSEDACRQALALTAVSCQLSAVSKRAES